MELKINTKHILKVLHALSWIIFIGICIEAGAIIGNAILTLAFPAGARHFWREVDLLALYGYDPGYFFVQALLIGIVAVMKACIFYLIVKMLHNKKLNMSRPFNPEMGRFMFSVSYLSLGIGLFSWWGVKYAAWLTEQGVEMPDVQHLRLGGADVWLFMGVTLFVVALIFKRGIEIQTENELTV